MNSKNKKIEDNFPLTEDAVAEPENLKEAAGAKKYKKLKKPDIKKLVGMAMFTALAVAVAYACSWLKVAFLSFDMKDAVIVIASFIYGPLSAIPMALIAALIELIWSGTGIYGVIMNFSSSMCFSFVAALIYKYRRTLTGAILALYTGCILTVIVMMVLNTFLTPLYLETLGMSAEVAKEYVKEYLPILILPFNISKVLMNSAIAMFLYKPVTEALSRAGMIKRTPKSLKFNKYSAILLTFFTVTFIAAILLFVVTKSMN